MYSLNLVTLKKVFIYLLTYLLTYTTYLLTLLTYLLTNTSYLLTHSLTNLLGIKSKIVLVRRSKKLKADKNIFSGFMAWYVLGCKWLSEWAQVIWQASLGRGNVILYNGQREERIFIIVVCICMKCVSFLWMFDRAGTTTLHLSRLRNLATQTFKFIYGDSLSYLQIFVNKKESNFACCISKRSSFGLSTCIFRYTHLLDSSWPRSTRFGINSFM